MTVGILNTLFSFSCFFICTDMAWLPYPNASNYIFFQKLRWYKSFSMYRRVPFRIRWRRILLRAPLWALFRRRWQTVWFAKGFKNTRSKIYWSIYVNYTQYFNLLSLQSDLKVLAVWTTNPNLAKRFGMKLTIMFQLFQEGFQKNKSTQNIFNLILENPIIKPPFLTRPQSVWITRILQQLQVITILIFDQLVSIATSIVPAQIMLEFNESSQTAVTWRISVRAKSYYLLL